MKKALVLVNEFSSQIVNTQKITIRSESKIIRASFHSINVSTTSYLKVLNVI